MIVVKLKGGLANQMFQYALGRNLSLRKNVPLLFDLTHYEKEQSKEKTIRNYELDVFNLKVPIATNEEIKSSKGWYRSALKRKTNTLCNKFKPYYKKNILKEQQNKFDRNVLFAPKDCYLEGFWQSELYFKDFESIIRQDFEFNTFLNSKNQSNLNQIKKCQCPVSVHIRRGDYIHSSHYSKIHITLNSTFYNKATSFMEKKIANPTYFVFSDDIEWAKKNLSFKHPTIFIDNNNNENSFEDMRLMSNCKHHIIANSTFSWWGAWLNSSKEKIVIAPQKWFKIEELEKKDLIPKEWITI